MQSLRRALAGDVKLSTCPVDILKPEHFILFGGFAGPKPDQCDRFLGV